MELTKEEREELSALEAEEDARRKAVRLATQRQHLEALRTSKRLAKTHGTPGVDFAICETVVGNVAVRRPTDLEMDAERGDMEQRENLEKFVLELTIDPAPDEVRKLFVAHAGVVIACAQVIKVLQNARREEDVKK